MNAEHEAIVNSCATDSMAGRVPFKDIVGRLGKVGIERYHVDFSRMETTYYFRGGESVVVSMGANEGPIAKTFQSDLVESAVRQSQRGEIIYPQFISKARVAGCVGYFVLLEGKRVQYFGRQGEVHTELFPDPVRK